MFSELSTLIASLPYCGDENGDVVLAVGMAMGRDITETEWEWGIGTVRLLCPRVGERLLIWTAP